MHSSATIPAGAPSQNPRRTASREPAWRLALDWFERANALAAREVRLALRSPRAWLLLSLYVSILGAVVLTQFPSDTQVEMWGSISTSSGSASSATSATSGVPSSQRGQALLHTFALAQFLGVWLLVPSLAAGALHQEREGQTLESLLLSPLTPMQIVWGKLCGVLAMTFVLLLGTLPLTSLCFLLGGVAPEDVALRFFGLLAWAMFCGSVGLYCASRTASVAQATAQAYGLSLVGLATALVMLGPGVALATIGFLVWLVREGSGLLRTLISRAFGKKEGAPGAASGTRAFLGLCGALLLAVALLGAAAFLRGQGLSVILWTALLIFPYGVYISQLGINAAAAELAKKAEPSAPKREALRQMAESWQGNSAPNSVSYGGAAAPAKHASAYSDYSYAEPAPVGATASTSRPATAQAEPAKPTYGVQEFLSDRRNPIFARDLRDGIGGKSATLVRWGYCALIATQLFLIFALSGGAANAPFLGSIIKAQVVLVMVACAWLGARSIAPERETQTLQQLLTLPMPASHIISGKISSVLYFSLYVLLAGLPLILMLPLAYVASWSSALSLVALQCAWGLLAGAWGVFCSLRCVKVRRAMAWSLGGVFALLFGTSVAQSTLMTAASSLGGGAAYDAVTWSSLASPMSLVEVGIGRNYVYSLAANPPSMPHLGVLWISVGVAGAVAVVLFTASARAFANLARQG